MITFLSAGFTTPYNDVLNPFSLWVQFFPVFLLIVLFKVFEKWVEIPNCDDSNERYWTTPPFTMLLVTLKKQITDVL